VIRNQTILPRLRAAMVFLVTAVVTVAAAGAARAPAHLFEKRLPLLTWVGEFTRPSGTILPQQASSLRFGSLSGLAPDERSQQWIAAIDDRSNSRVAWLTVAGSEKGMEVTVTRMLPLRPGVGMSDRVTTEADLEAIVALRDGTFLLAEEGHRIEGNVWQPALLRMNRDGVVTAAIDFPVEMQITGDGKSGLRENQGFESLTVTPKGRVITGLEQPLVQDGLVSFERGGAGRLIEFVPAGSTFRPGKQWRYMISPTPRLEGYPDTCTDGENGLVELLALSETRLISMERACVTDRESGRTANTVQLFMVDLVEGDARKQELLNFDAMASRLSPALATLENFEAMTFGPVINGIPTLLIASDDNFRKTQKTAFLLLGMR
jgi:hypothetical protein